MKTEKLKTDNSKHAQLFEYLNYQYGIIPTNAEMTKIRSICDSVSVYKYFYNNQLENSYNHLRQSLKSEQKYFCLLVAACIAFFMLLIIKF